MTEVKNILSIIEKQSEKHSNDERFVRTIQKNQVVRQGDIYLLVVEANHSKGKKIKDRQLAPGNTKGSRHIVEGKVKLYEGNIVDDEFGSALTGPVIVADERFTVTHPEHADVSLPSGTYQVGYQADPRTRERVAD